MHGANTEKLKEEVDKIDNRTPTDIENQEIERGFGWIMIVTSIVFSAGLMIATYLCWHDGMPIWVKEFLG